MWNNVAAEIAVEPSMLTALRRPRMTVSALCAPDRIGRSNSSASDGNAAKSSSIAASGLVVAAATSSITGQATWSRLSRLALPYHRVASDDRESASITMPGSPPPTGETTAMRSGCSRSASVKSASRSSPRTCSVPHRRVARAASRGPPRRTGGFRARARRRAGSSGTPARHTSTPRATGSTTNRRQTIPRAALAVDR